MAHGTPFPWHCCIFLPGIRSHMATATVSCETWLPTPQCTQTRCPASGPPLAEAGQAVRPTETRHPAALPRIHLNHFVGDLQAGKMGMRDFMSKGLLVYLLRACRGEVTKRTATQFVAIRENVLHEICTEELMFRNVKMRVYEILVSQVLQNYRILMLEDTDE